MNSSDGPFLKAEPYKGLSDFTLFFSADAAEQEISEKIRNIIKGAVRDPEQMRNQRETVWSYPDSLSLELDNNTEEFRSLICSCFRNEYYSVTLRSTGGRRDWGSSVASPSEAYTSTADRYHSNYDPKDVDEKESPAIKDKFLFRWSEYCEVLGDAILPGNESRQGLVVVAGATAAGKSKVTRGLIHRYLTHRIASQTHKLDRRPHLLTFEDPIELRYFDNPEIAQATGLDYTPRQKGIDVTNLQQLFDDSLRQTPAAVYIGETRRADDWKALVDFAGKGHLVFTTCHAGSLTEVISAIRDATHSTTAAARSALASRLLAVVHLRGEKIVASEAFARPKGALLAALWLRTAAGINFFTADGLSAVLPHSAISETHKESRYCFGRGYFARALLEKAEQRRTEVEIYQSSLQRRAVELDLEGL